MRRLALLLVLAGAGCDALPRDVDGTSDRIARSRTIRVGLTEPPSAEATRFLHALSTQMEARIAPVAGSLEPLLEALDHDRVDLVVTPIRADGLLAEAVALTPPLDGSEAGDRPVQWRAAARNGENRWIVMVERAARKGAGK